MNWSHFFTQMNTNIQGKWGPRNAVVLQTCSMAESLNVIILDLSIPREVHLLTCPNLCPKCGEKVG